MIRLASRQWKSIVACCVVSAVSAGCTQTIYYTPQVVTLRLDRPVFTVIPRNLSPEETDWSAEIQRCLLLDRLQVIERPALLQAETKVAGAEDEQETQETKAEATIDVVATYAKTDAEIIVASDRSNRRVKFIDKGREYEILASGQVPQHHYTREMHTCEWVHKTLVGLGFNATAK